MLRHSPVAIHTDAANAQHYELPPAFFELCLGPRLKYSGCYYPRGDESLDEAEEAMLALYGERAELADGQDDSGAGLRLGLADAVDGRALSAMRGSPPSRTRTSSASTSRRSAASAAWSTCA